MATVDFNGNLIGLSKVIKGIAVHSNPQVTRHKFEEIAVFICYKEEEKERISKDEVTRQKFEEIAVFICYREREKKRISEDEIRTLFSHNCKFLYCLFVAIQGSGQSQTLRLCRITCSLRSSFPMEKAD